MKNIERELEEFQVFKSSYEFEQIYFLMNSNLEVKN